MSEGAGEILIRGGQVYDRDGDTDRPPVADLLIHGDRIAGIGQGSSAAPDARVIDAAGKLVMPGFVNTHYHSHDILYEGLLRDDSPWTTGCCTPCRPTTRPARWKRSARGLFWGRPNACARA